MTICDWHTVQDEEHVLLDYPHEELVNLCTQHRQLVFPLQYEDSRTRLTTFFNPGCVPDVYYCVDSFVTECPRGSLFGIGYRPFPWLQMPPRGI